MPGSVAATLRMPEVRAIFWMTVAATLLSSHLLRVTAVAATLLSSHKALRVAGGALGVLENKRGFSTDGTAAAMEARSRF